MITKSQTVWPAEMTRVNQDTFATEASIIGLRPRHWPRVLRLENSRGLFHFRMCEKIKSPDGRTAGYVYRHVTHEHKAIRVLNS